MSIRHCLRISFISDEKLSRKNLELKEKLFKEVREKLTAYKKDPSYEEYLERKIREAVTFAGNDKLNPTLSGSVRRSS